MERRHLAGVWQKLVQTMATSELSFSPLRVRGEKDAGFHTPAGCGRSTLATRRQDVGVPGAGVQKRLTPAGYRRFHSMHC